MASDYGLNFGFRRFDRGFGLRRGYRIGLTGARGAFGASGSFFATRLLFAGRPFFANHRFRRSFNLRRRLGRPFPRFPLRALLRKQ